MTSESTLKPFSPGDVFVGATLLNDPDDDHAGRGRIMQYDAGLVEKGVLWIDDSTHLVGGLKIDPNGVLWAFDSNAHLVIRVGSDGRRLPDMEFAKRSFSNVNFGPNGHVYLAEHLVGSEIRLPLKTTLTRTARQRPNGRRSRVRVHGQRRIGCRTRHRHPRRHGWLSGCHAFRAGARRQHPGLRIRNRQADHALRSQGIAAVAGRSHATRGRPQGDVLRPWDTPKTAPCCTCVEVPWSS